MADEKNEEYIRVKVNTISKKIINILNQLDGAIEPSIRGQIIGTTLAGIVSNVAYAIISDKEDRKSYIITIMNSALKGLENAENEENK